MAEILAEIHGEDVCFLGWYGTADLLKRLHSAQDADPATRTKVEGLMAAWRARCAAEDQVMNGLIDLHVALVPPPLVQPVQIEVTQ